MALNWVKRDPDDAKNSSAGADRDGRTSPSAQPQGPEDLRFFTKNGAGSRPPRTSERRIKANRKNSGHSTGPKTKKGKEISRFNAVKHGVYAKDFVLIGFEDPVEFERMYLLLRDQWAQAGPTGELLVETLAHRFWERRRLTRIQAAVHRRAQLDAIWEAYLQRPEMPKDADARDERRFQTIAELEEDLETVETLICRVEADTAAEALPECLEELSLSELFDGIDLTDREFVLEKLRFAHDRLNIEIAALHRDQLPLVMDAYARMAPVDLDRCRADILRDIKRILRELKELQDLFGEQE